MILLEHFNSLLTDGFVIMKIDPSEPSEIPEETLTCDTCGLRLDTVESLKEHKLSEVKDVELKDKGVSSLAILSMKEKSPKVLLFTFKKLSPACSPN